MSALPPPTDPAPQTLATAVLPRRVRRILEQLLNAASDDLERALTATVGDFEQQLFRMSEHTRNPSQQAGYMQTLRTLRTQSSDLVPRFMAALETNLASMGRPSSTSTESTPIAFTHLSLVDENEMDEEAVLREIAARQESRASLPLHLLGQRFGVMAASPAFDSERMPLGPRVLCRIMRESSHSMQLPLESRLLLYRQFDRRVMTDYPQLAEMLNSVLVANGILPSLTYVPIRARPTSIAEADAAAAAAKGDGKVRRRRDGEPGDQQRTHTAWLGQPAGETAGFDEGAAFDLLQQLLTGRRELLGKLRPNLKPGKPRQQLETTELVAALGEGHMREAVASGNMRSLLDIKQALLAQARQKQGHAAVFSPQDSDTFELLDMLYTQIEREVRNDAPATPLLRKLQLPLLRLALQDRAFFVRAQHPARQLLNAVAESGARWLDNDDIDPQLLQPLQQAVDNIANSEGTGTAIFDANNRELQVQLQNLARKAEMAERRHVEAARGKEKLEIAKRRAGDTINELIGEERLPKFVRALLNQAWADVLTLTLLRQGQDSPDWERQLDVTRRIVATCGRAGGVSDPELANHIEGALGQVGYHAEEAAAIARRLTSALDDEEDPASRTELTMRLKARVRLGEDASETRKPELPPRDAAEQAQYDQLRVMPYGTWIEFTVNQQGDLVRRRLSWYSPVTDKALFVNQRGQRVGEQSLDSVARMLTRGQAKIVAAERGRLVDRAWQATLNALRSFAGRGAKDDAGADASKTGAAS